MIDEIEAIPMPQLAVGLIIGIPAGALLAVVFIVRRNAIAIFRWFVMGRGA